MEKFKNKKVVITGGSRGIGRAIALAFAQEGADLIITYNSDSKAAAEVINDIGKFAVKAKSIQVDMSSDQDRNFLLEESYAFLGDVNILVNNAGIVTRNSFVDLTQEEIEKVIKVNLLTPFFLMQDFSKKMIVKQDNLLKIEAELNDYCIINITSISKEIIIPGLAHYEASKAGLSQLTKSVAMDLAPYKIRVNEVAPGLIPTDINKIQRENNSEIWQNRIAGIPLGRAGSPREIADTVLFLAGNQYVTGTTIVVDGGRMCNWQGAR